MPFGNASSVEIAIKAPTSATFNDIAIYPCGRKWHFLLANGIISLLKQAKVNVDVQYMTDISEAGQVFDKIFIIPKMVVADFLRYAKSWLAIRRTLVSVSTSYVELRLEPRNLFRTIFQQCLDSCQMFLQAFLLFFLRIFVLL